MPIPEVSAGSNHVGAMFAWIAQVICPRGSRGWAAAALSRSPPCDHAARPATPPRELWKRRRRVRDVTRCRGLRVIYLLGGKTDGHPLEGPRNGLLLIFQCSPTTFRCRNDQ